MGEPTRSETINSFNRTMDLIVKIFDFLWFDHAEDGET